MTELTLEELDSLEMLQCSRGQMMVAYGDMVALIAMARELARLNSALEFIRQCGDARDPPSLFDVKSVERLCNYARLLGWSDQTAPAPPVRGDG